MVVVGLHGGPTDIVYVNLCQCHNDMAKSHWCILGFKSDDVINWCCREEIFLNRFC